MNELLVWGIRGGGKGGGPSREFETLKKINVNKKKMEEAVREKSPKIQGNAAWGGKVEDRKEGKKEMVDHTTTLWTKKSEEWLFFLCPSTRKKEQTRN